MTVAGRLSASWGDFADPSILRVGHDFYFTHTSYRYAPGLVVWHSRDSVNWLPISQAMPDLQGTQAEIWAPDLVEHAGRYFITNVLHGFQSLRPALAASGDGTARFTDFRYRAL